MADGLIGVTGGTITLGHETAGNDGGCGNGPSPHEDSGRSGGGISSSDAAVVVVGAMIVAGAMIVVVVITDGDVDASAHGADGAGAHDAGDGAGLHAGR